MTTINYIIYNVVRNMVVALRKQIPVRLLRQNKDLSAEFCIGITTYIERYEDYFLPLYRHLTRTFPEVRIVVAVNGIEDNQRHQSYLATIEQELASQAPSSHLFILHDIPVGLTTLWNEILSFVFPQTALILNDDLSIFPWFRKWVEKFNWNINDIVLINNSWSHYVLPLNVYLRVGEFDESFKGIGFEDMDYTARLGLLNLPIYNVLCPYLYHHDEKPTLTSYDTLSPRIWGKYTSSNQEHFFNKWRECSASEGVYIRQIDTYVTNKFPLSPPSISRDFPKDWGCLQNCVYPDRTTSVHR